MRRGFPPVALGRTVHCGFSVEGPRSRQLLWIAGAEHQLLTNPGQPPNGRWMVGIQLHLSSSVSENDRDAARGGPEYQLVGCDDILPFRPSQELFEQRANRSRSLSFWPNLAPMFVNLWRATFGPDSCSFGFHVGQFGLDFDCFCSASVDSRPTLDGNIGASPELAPASFRSKYHAT